MSILVPQLSGKRTPLSVEPDVLDEKSRSQKEHASGSSISPAGLPSSQAPRPSIGFTETAGLSISRSLAKRVAGTGVTVNAILPGPTLSDGLEAMLKQQQKASGLSLEASATTGAALTALVSEVLSVLGLLRNCETFWDHRKQKGCWRIWLSLGDYHVEDEAFGEFVRRRKAAGARGDA